MDDQGRPWRGEGGSSLPGNRYTPRSGARPRSPDASSRGPRDQQARDWRDDGWQAPSRSPSGRRSAARDSWNDEHMMQRRSAQAGYAGESAPRSRASRAEAWSPALAAKGRGAPPKKSGRRIWLFVLLGLLLVAAPTALLLSQWSRIQAVTGIGGSDPLFPWAQQSQQTAVNPDYDAFATQQATLDPAFGDYYDTHAGAALLGTPLTGALPTSAGLTQFFTSGALLLPAAHPASGGASSGDTALQLAGPPPGASAGASARASAVTRLPLPAALLKLGSQLQVGALSYGALRAAAQPEQLVQGTPATPAPDATASAAVLFGVKGSAGHTIPPAIWAYVNGSTTSPAGMLANFGRPLTEALETTATVEGAPHHVTVQPFWYAIVIMDHDAQDAKGQPKMSLASVGTDYLRTLGPPSVTLAAKTPAWGNATAPLLDAPATGKPVATIGANFPLTLSGETQWRQATLWYRASFTAAKRSGAGWAPAAALTLTAPPKDARSAAGLDMLSPDLAAFVASQNQNMGVAIYDITRNQYYGLNDTAPTYGLASTAKVYLMLAYLDQVESQNRALRADEVNTLTIMIENSDNNAAQLTWIRLGYDSGSLLRFQQKLGITGYKPCADGWGCAELTAGAMITALTALQQGKILTAEHRQFALNLMSNIEADNQWGVGDTAPKGAKFYMKDGWLTDYDGTWLLNSVGIVTLGNETYAISVYSQKNPTFDWSKVDKVCGDVGKLLNA
jgi:hypothetical protein